MLFNRIRYVNKYILNRVMLRFAGSPHSQFAVVRHIGRRSGRTYTTPIIVASLGADVVVALTYGPNVDWYRNLRAAGHAILRWQGRTYTVEEPQEIDPTTALPRFPAVERFILPLLGIQRFVRLRLVEPMRGRT